MEKTVLRSYEEVAKEIGARTNTNPGFVLELMLSDNIGGEPLGDTNQKNKAWPEKSMHESEGRVLHALVRIKKPETVVEIGSWRGCSTSHIASAIHTNGTGILHAVDPEMDLSLVEPQLLEHIVQNKISCFDWTPPGKIDLMLEDGAHTPGFTKAVWERFLPFMNRGSIAASHDIFFVFPHPNFIEEEFRSVIGNNYIRIQIPPSPCGIAIAFL
jgi:predicted O-methyltransferase YrrM